MATEHHSVGAAEHTLGRMIESDHGATLEALTGVQMRFIYWMIDILLAVVILNLFNEFAPNQISFDSFWITLLVAVLFQVLLSAMNAGKKWLQDHLRSRNRSLLAAVGVLPVFFVGKLIILETVDAVFTQVELVGFWYEWFLIFFLIVVPAIVWALFDRLGQDA